MAMQTGQAAVSLTVKQRTISLEHHFQLNIFLLLWEEQSLLTPAYQTKALLYQSVPELRPLLTFKNSIKKQRAEVANQSRPSRTRSKKPVFFIFRPIGLTKKGISRNSSTTTKGNMSNGQMNRKMTAEMLDESKDRLTTLLEKGGDVDLSDGQVDSVDVCALSSLLASGEVPQLTGLNLRNNQLTDSLLCTLAAALNYDSSVKKLDLGDNQLTQKGVYHLLLCLTTFNETLEELDLDNNVEICSLGVKYLGEIIENSSSLIKLTLSGIYMRSCADVLAMGLKKNCTLKILNMQSAELGTKGTYAFIKILTEKDSEIQLEELNLSFNPIDNGDFEVYEPLFTNEKFKTLKTLHLSFNQMIFNASNKFSEVVSKGLRKNSTLKEIYLRGNLFNDKDGRNFSMLLASEQSALEILDIVDNCISMQGARSLLFDVQRTPRMKYLGLGENNFLDEEGGEEMLEQIEANLARNRGEGHKPGSSKSKGKSVGKQGKIKRDSPAKYEPPRRKSSEDEAVKKTPITSFNDTSNEDEPTIVFRTEVGENQKFDFDGAQVDGDDKSKDAGKLNNHQPDSLRSMRQRFSVESNLGADEPLIILSARMRRLVKTLSPEFPQIAIKTVKRRKTEDRPSPRRKSKRKFAKKLQTLAMLKTEKYSETPVPLSQSLIHQKLISQGLAKSARLLSTAEGIENDFEGESSILLPGALFDELTSGGEGEELLPGIALLEMFVKSMKKLNTVTWSVLQSFLAYPNASKPLCQKIVNSFFRNLKETGDDAQFSGAVVLEALCCQMADVLLLLKPLYVYAEALWMVMSSERSTQKRLSYYEKRDAKLEARAMKHLDKRRKKVEKLVKVDNLKKHLLKAKEHMQQAREEGSASSQMSLGRVSTSTKNTTASDSLQKVLKGVRMATKVEQRKKAKNATLQRKEKTKPVVQLSEEVIRFRENCPERIEDILDELVSENDMLLNLVSIEEFMDTLLLFVDASKVRAHVKGRAKLMSTVFQPWFTDLKTEFNSQELDNLLPELMNDISAALQDFGDWQGLAKQFGSLKRGASFSGGVSVATSCTVSSSKSKVGSKVKGMISKFGKKRKNKGKAKKRIMVDQLDNDFNQAAEMSSRSSAKIEFDVSVLDSLLVGTLSSSKAIKKLKSARETMKTKKKLVAEKKAISQKLQSVALAVCQETMCRKTMKLKDEFEALL